MAADATVDQVADSDGGKRRFSPKRLLLFVGLPVILLLAGGGLLASGVLGGGSHGTTAAGGEVARADASKSVIFHDLPEMLVNLQTDDRRASYLKMQVSLELDDPVAVERLKAVQPRVVDHFQVYLRELRASDLRGSAGMARLREELMRRVNLAIAPLQIKDVLFREILVQ